MYYFDQFHFKGNQCLLRCLQFHYHKFPYINFNGDILAICLCGWSFGLYWRHSGNMLVWMVVLPYTGDILAICKCGWSFCSILETFCKYISMDGRFGLYLNHSGNNLSVDGHFALNWRHSANMLVVMIVLVYIWAILAITWWWL